MPEFDRWRFKTTSVEDYRPIVFNPKYPWWCSGYGEDRERGEYAVIIAYLPPDALIKDYWPEYFDAELLDTGIIKFSDRFPRPNWFIE